MYFLNLCEVAAFQKAALRAHMEHAKKPDYTDGIHAADFAAEVSRYQLLSPDENPYYDMSDGAN